MVLNYNNGIKIGKHMNLKVQEQDISVQRWDEA